MKLAVRKEEGRVPGGGFHYMLHPMKLESDAQAASFKLIGYAIIEVEESHGERLIEEAGRAINHQVEVAILTEKALKQ